MVFRRLYSSSIKVVSAASALRSHRSLEHFNFWLRALQKQFNSFHPLLPIFSLMRFSHSDLCAKNSSYRSFDNSSSISSILARKMFYFKILYATSIYPVKSFTFFIDLYKFIIIKLKSANILNLSGIYSMGDQFDFSVLYSVQNMHDMCSTYSYPTLFKNLSKAK